MALESTPVCGVCDRAVDDSRKAYTCVCGKTYHPEHAADGLCINCWRPLESRPSPSEDGNSIRCPTCGEVERIEVDADPARWKCGNCGVILKEIARKYNYLIIGEEPHVAYDWFVSVVRKRIPGLCMSTAFPDKLQREYGLPDIEQYWLSDTAMGTRSLDPRRLEFEVMRALSNFLKANKGGALLVDGLEYLVVENGFDKVFKFIKKVTDLSSVYEATLFVTLAPEGLELEQMTRLRKEFDRVEIVQSLD